MKTRIQRLYSLPTTTRPRRNSTSASFSTLPASVSLFDGSPLPFDAPHTPLFFDAPPPPSRLPTRIQTQSKQQNSQGQGQPANSNLNGLALTQPPQDSSGAPLSLHAQHHLNNMHFNMQFIGKGKHGLPLPAGVHSLSMGAGEEVIMDQKEVGRRRRVAIDGDDRYLLDVGAYGIPKRRKGDRRERGRERGDQALHRAVQVGEDAYFVRDDAVGVADGVGGWRRTATNVEPRGESSSPSAVFARRMMHFAAEELEIVKASSLGPSGNAVSPPNPDLELYIEHHNDLKSHLSDFGETVDVLQILERAYERTVTDIPPGTAGSSTALVAVLDYELVCVGGSSPSPLELSGVSASSSAPSPPPLNTGNNTPRCHPPTVSTEIPLSPRFFGLNAADTVMESGTEQTSHTLAQVAEALGDTASVEQGLESVVRTNAQPVLRIAHIGDCMGMLVRDNHIVWRSEEMWWEYNTPVQLSVPQKPQPSMRSEQEVSALTSLFTSTSEFLAGTGVLGGSDFGLFSSLWNRRTSQSTPFSPSPSSFRTFTTPSMVSPSVSYRPSQEQTSTTKISPKDTIMQITEPPTTSTANLVTPRTTAQLVTLPVQVDDILVLASDGLSDNLWDEDVLDEVLKFSCGGGSWDGAEEEVGATIGRDRPVEIADIAEHATTRMEGISLENLPTPLLSPACYASARREPDSTFTGKKDMSVTTLLQRKAKAARISEALCSRAWRVSEQRGRTKICMQNSGKMNADDETPFARRARELGRVFSGGKRDGILVNLLLDH